MWTQDYLSAPWTKTELFTQITSNLTDVFAGWTVYEDKTGEALPYIIYRNDTGLPGRDICLWLDLTDSTNVAAHVTYRTFLFETSAYTLNSGNLPANFTYGSAGDLDSAVNLLVTHANTPNTENMMFWFEQADYTFGPTSLFAIDPYTLSDGTTLLNTGDDGSGYPLWCTLQMYWQPNTKQGGAYFDRTNANFSIYFDPSYQSGAYIPYIEIQVSTQNPNVGNQMFNNETFHTNDNVRAPHFVTTRSPLGVPYTINVRGAGWTAVELGSGTYSPTLTLPTKRIDAWSGAGVLVEGFRPEIFTGSFVNSVLNTDPRGYVGHAGDVLVARSFGGAVADSFSVGTNQYRIVNIISDGSGGGLLQVSFALKVSDS